MGVLSAEVDGRSLVAVGLEQMLQTLIRLTVLLAISNAVYAQTPLIPEELEPMKVERRDGRADASFSLPPSGTVQVWGGWSHPFRWLPEGFFNPIDKKVDRIFGYAYVRPNVRLLTSIKVNQGEFRLDIYPVSFLGGTIGTVLTHSNLENVQKFEEWSGYNCESIQCKGFNTTNFYELKLKWALPSKVFGVVFWRQDFTKSVDRRFAYAFDPGTGLPFDVTGDFTRHYFVIVGRPVSDRASLSARYRNLTWRQAGSYRGEFSGIYQYKLKEPWSIAFEGRQIYRKNYSDFLSATLALSYVWRDSPDAENQL